VPIKKVFIGMVGLLVVTLCLSLVACGDATATPSNANAVVASTTAATSGQATTTASSPVNSALTTPSAFPTSEATASPAVTTVPAPSLAAGKTGTNQIVTPDKVVTRLYTGLKSDDAKKIDAAILSQDLRNSIKGSKGDKSKGLAGLNSLVGLNNGQKIDTFTLDQLVLTDNSASVNVAVKLTDGTSLKDSVTLVKSQVKNKQGDERSLWQIDKISLVN
jgi:hypothetical protein